MSDLFTSTGTTGGGAGPLAARMRPTRLEDILGQDHVLNQGGVLRRAIEADRLSSIILYGPPGCGKTSLAEVIAGATRRQFDRTSGVLANVAELRRLLEGAKRRRAGQGVGTILFIDEIHRFSKSQQDVLLPYVEDGSVTLVGATTHNPLFFINAPLTSRSLIVELRPLDAAAVPSLLKRVLPDESGLASYAAEVDEGAIGHIARLSEGDARRALNALEIAVMTTHPGPDGRIHITPEVAAQSMQKKIVVYDHDEDGHYDTISAFIKSVRGGDPDAAVYWLAKMLYAGEDPRFVARRLIILASEDIGNADPRGLLIATAAMEAVDFVGMPEARIILSQATTYLATAPKSNAAYMAVNKAMGDVEAGRALPVPEHLKNVHIPAMGREAGAKYLYPHDFQGHHVAQVYAEGAARYYQPTGQGYEATIRDRLARWRGEAPHGGAAPAAADGGGAG